MHARQPFGEPALALADIGGAGIVRSVGKPERHVAAAECARQADAVETMLHGALADLGLWIAERTELVVLILEQVRVDGADANTGGRRCRLHGCDIALAVRQIPQHVQRHRRTRTGQRVDLSRIRNLLRDGRRGGGLQVLPEAGAGVGEAPGRQFDGKRIQRGADDLGRVVAHGHASYPQVRVVSQSETTAAKRMLSHPALTLCV